MWRAERWKEAKQDVESRGSAGGISVPCQHRVLTATQSLSTAKPALAKLDWCAPVSLCVPSWMSAMMSKRTLPFSLLICSIIRHPCTRTLTCRRKDHSPSLDTLTLSPDSTNEPQRANTDTHTYTTMLQPALQSFNRNRNHKCLKESNHSSIHRQQQPIATPRHTPHSSTVSVWDGRTLERSV